MSMTSLRGMHEIAMGNVKLSMGTSLDGPFVMRENKGEYHERCQHKHDAFE